MIFPIFFVAVVCHFKFPFLTASEYHIVISVVSNSIKWVLYRHIFETSRRKGASYYNMMSRQNAHHVPIHSATDTEKKTRWLFECEKEKRDDAICRDNAFITALFFFHLYWVSCGIDSQMPSNGSQHIFSLSFDCSFLQCVCLWALDSDRTTFSRCTTVFCVFF